MSYSSVTGADSPGNDIPGASYSNATVSSCMNTCNSNPECKGFTFINNTCNPKNSAMTGSKQNNPAASYYFKNTPPAPQGTGQGTGQEEYEKILNDIESLQQLEQPLLNSLETNPNLTPQEQQKIIEKMNQISNMRINLYEITGNINTFFQNSLTSSVGTLKEQVIAIGIVENELNQSKKRLELLESERNNKIRLVEINNYYGDKYAEHSQIMKIVIFTLIPVIILVVLNNKGILPTPVYSVLLIIISAIGGYFFWIRLASIISRDNMNYQAYNWYFDANSAPSVTTSSSSSSSDPWANNNATTICIGQACCSTGQVWDASLNQCTGSSSVNTESFINNMTPTDFNESDFVNSILTKKENGKYKTDYNMGSIQAISSPSFINNMKI